MALRSALTTTWLLVLIGCNWFTLANSPLYADEAEAATDDETAEVAQPADDEGDSGNLIDFGRDVWPILNAKCLECHGPEDAKNDFRVDDHETMLAYLEPHVLEDSSLWVDYLLSDDPDMRMPPPSDDPSKALTGVELATLKLWIEEGAQWDHLATVDAAATNAEPEVVAVPASLLARVWSFQGLFHPATVHFPVALLTVSAGFTLLSFFRPQTCEPVAFHCLWIGALGAIAASAAGWAYAVHEGYGTGFSFDFQESAIDRHRWLGIGVATLAVILIPMAVYVRRTGDVGMRLMWFVGALCMVAAVSIAGYQGGELTYGEGHYEKEFERLFPSQAVALPAEETGEAADVDSPADSDETPEI